MTITYSIPLQTVTLTMTPDELHQVGKNGLEDLKDAFGNIVDRVKQTIEVIKDKVTP